MYIIKQKRKSWKAIQRIKGGYYALIFVFCELFIGGMNCVCTIFLSEAISILNKKKTW